LTAAPDPDALPAPIGEQILDVIGHMADRLDRLESAVSPAQIRQIYRVDGFLRSRIGLRSSNFDAVLCGQPDALIFQTLALVFQTPEQPLDVSGHSRGPPVQRLPPYRR
jgi:hypothetical protein